MAALHPLADNLRPILAQGALKQSWRGVELESGFLILCLDSSNLQT